MLRSYPMANHYPIYFDGMWDYSLMANKPNRVLRQYRGFEIVVEREGPTLYWGIIRINDGWEMESNFAETTEDILTMTQVLSGHVDDYYENPKDYNE